jgi:hypothetical protein
MFKCGDIVEYKCGLVFSSDDPLFETKKRWSIERTRLKIVHLDSDVIIITDGLQYTHSMTSHVNKLTTNKNRAPQKDDSEKTKYTLLDFEFLKAMSDNMANGLVKDRKPNDWKKIKWTPETEAQYMSALLRHTLEGFNPAAIACNAMIIAYHQNKKIK